MERERDSWRSGGRDKERWRGSTSSSGGDGGTGSERQVWLGPSWAARPARSDGDWRLNKQQQRGILGSLPVQQTLRKSNEALSSSSSSVGHVVPRMHSMDITEGLSTPSESIHKLIPIRRPDRGGTSARQYVNLRVNHFPVKFNPESTIWHYDINIKLDAVSKRGQPIKVPKSDTLMIKNKLFLDNPSQFPMSMTAYDGEKNIFSAVRLPTGVFKMGFSKSEDTKIRTYTITIKLVNELKLCTLKSFLSGSPLSIPRHILQGMDVVMKENPGRHLISIGRSFYPAETREEDSLGSGVAASRGFQHSLKPTFQGLSLCLDYSVLAFQKRMAVVDYLRERIEGFDIQCFRRFRGQVKTVLKGLKVNVIHRNTKQKYTIVGLTDRNTEDILFTLEDPKGNAPTKVSLVQYFQEKYGRDVKYKNIPCLDLGKNKRPNYVPMEFCVLFGGQRCPLEHLSSDTFEKLKKISMPPPDVREKMIYNMVRGPSGPCGGDTTKNFGLEVNTEMTKMMGRVIEPPVLKVCSENGRMIKITIEGEKCQWSLVRKSVVEGKPIARWAILDFSSSSRPKLNQYIFTERLMARFRSLGILIQEPLFYEPASMELLSNVDILRNLLESVNYKSYEKSGDRLQILICIMSRKHPGYKYLKWLSETKIGVVTQCCLSSFANKGNDQFFANLAFKINAKLGGSNMELNDQFLSFGFEGHVMFVGVDVNHPSPHNKSSPSIAAIVASMNWPAANRYASRVRPQVHGKEKILQFGEMCLELAESYEQINKVKPKNILIFRDGVSETQFDMVLNEELVDLKRIFKTRKYSPSITVVVAQKRHQTRLFPESIRDGSSTGNVFPGTVVDTKIVHPLEFDFYLCSHYGSIGTSMPTHYHVLWDEYRFTSDELQKLIYHMCFTFARCSKPASLVPPVYYADLVAYRGRLYQEAVKEGRFQASAASFSWSLPFSSLDDSFFKLHADLENIMFFI